ncbi:hypothetical protein [Salinibacter ruber]|uniref:hypothetical protein n=1 Tax=Salinibacter ruber TaxID=146919 RepID=UPI002169345E|nr:hypothetical protein [Salinibacter ruber]MCS3708406.1 hypothetical protein [Salinibacter ruber]
MDASGFDISVFNTKTRHRRKSLAGLQDGGRASAMDSVSHGGNLFGSATKSKATVENGAATTSAAAATGTSTPDESSSSDEADGYSKTPPGCNCGEYRFDLDDGRTVSRRSTKVFCPVHGVNESFRGSYSENAAWVCRRSSYRRCDCYHATLTLHAADVDALGLSPGDTKGVLAQLLPRLRKRLKRRDSGAEALLSLSPRPSDGEWHMHVLVLSKGCTTADVFDVFDLDGTDVCITTPHSREKNCDDAPMSAETFAAAMGAYLFDNRVHGAVQGADTQFTAWGDDVGYFSDGARTRRRKYAEAMSAPGGDTAPARGSSTQKPTDEDNGGGRNGDDGRESAAADDENTGVQPVKVGTSAVQSADVYRRVVIRALMARLHTEVKVHGLGRCKLVWVEVGDADNIICSVRPLETMKDDKRTVPWRRIESTDTPVIESANNAGASTDMDTEHGENGHAPDENADESAPESDTAGGDTDGNGGGSWGASLAEKYVNNARHKRKVLVLPDGRRHVREYKDGEKIRDEKVAPRQSEGYLK